MKGSCAFEHVFLGEVKRGVVKGFHNWLFFLMQEQKGEVGAQDTASVSTGPGDSGGRIPGLG